MHGAGLIAAATDEHDTQAVLKQAATKKL